MTCLEPNLSTLVKAAIAILDGDSEQYVEPNAIFKHAFIGDKENIEIRVSDDLRAFTSVIVLVDGVIVLDVDWDGYNNSVFDTYEYLQDDDWEQSILSVAEYSGGVIPQTDW